MMKAMYFLKRRQGLDRGAFFKWWLGPHASLAKGLPGLRRYTVSLEAAGEDGTFDGVAELWYDDAVAFDASMAGAVGQAAHADADAYVSRLEGLHLAEHKFVDTGKPHGFKLVAALKRRKDLSRAQFKDWWLKRHAPLVVVFPELARYQVDLVEDGPEGFADGVAEVSFASLEALKRVTSSKQVKDAQQDSVEHTEARYRLFVEEHPLL
jgi:uncharacterized protein (TIGR02118 family)